MTVLNIILLIIGVLIFMIGLIWTTRDWLNIFIKMAFLFAGVYCFWYSLYLSNIILVINH